MHGMVAYILRFHRLESAGSDVESKFSHLDIMGIKVVKHFGREMQSGSGGSHRAFGIGIHGLVVVVVTLFRFAFQIGWDRDKSGSIHYGSECHVRIVPRKFNGVGIPGSGI